MIGVVIFIGLIIWLVLAFAAAENFMEIAAAKGFHDRKYWRWCFWLGLIGWAMVIALPDRGQNSVVSSTPAKVAKEKADKCGKKKYGAEITLHNEGKCEETKNYSEHLEKICGVGEIVTLGSYEQDSNTEDGKDAIAWRVLARERNRILVISEYAIDCQPYHDSNTDVTWEDCFLRRWLNGTFFNAAFSKEEQTAIQSAKVLADKNPKFSKNPGNETTDKVFLLSIAEVEKYFSSNIERQCESTEHATTNGAYVNNDDENCWWWLRSPGGDQRNAAYVSNAGSVIYFGNNVNFERGCVRPAMWVKLDS